jgi:hypothetical protein
MLLQILAAAAMAAPPQPGPRLDAAAFAAPAPTPVVADDSVRRRRKAIEYSDAYYTRLTIHRVASYAELPLFAAEYVLGERLLKEQRTGFPSQGLKTAHTTVALGLGALFTINTVTGVWNLWDSRANESGRSLRIIHSLAMLGADAGFALAGASGGSANNSTADANHHRTIALSSMGLATAGTLMMWVLH